jgi:hypothetical protein
MINETKQTAIDWLYLKLATSSSEEMVGNINVWFEEAKEIEKQNIKDAFIEGDNNGLDYFNPMTKTLTSEQYYNETYGGNNEQQ